MTTIRYSMILVLPTLTVLLACGGGGSSSSTSPGTSTPPQVGSTNTYLAPNGTAQTVPMNLSTTLVESWVPSASGFANYPGSGTSTGVLDLGSAPSGAKWVELKMGAGTPVYLWTDASATELDLGTTVMGRPNAATARAPTPVTLNVGSMDPWSSRDSLEWYSPNLGQCLDPLLNFSYLTNAPQAGATSLSGLSFDWIGTLDTRLVDGGKGDRLYLTRFASHAVGSGVARGLSQSFQPGAFTMVSGAPTTLSGNFTSVPQTGTVQYQWDGAAFSALSGQLSPSLGAYLWDDRSYLDVQPGGTAFGPAYANPDLFMTSYLGAYSGTVGPYSYGNPYPPTWPLVFGVQVYYAAAVVAPGATRAGDMYLLYVKNDLGAPALGSTITPALGPIQSPTINGADATVPTTGVGTDPTLAWSQPTLGSATDYQVSVFLIGNNAGSTTRARVADLYTTGTQMMIPPGVLAAGSTYVFVIRALHRPGVDASRHPFRSTFDQGLCDFMTGLVTP